MKVLVIGLGSMGKRRIRNLRALGVNDIYGYDTERKSRTEAKEFRGVTFLDRLDTVGAFDFDLAIISTPPGVHLPAAHVCAQNRIPFFVEFNLIAKEARAIQGLSAKYNVPCFASNTELFDPDIKRLGALLDKRFKGYFVYHLGQNIHDWHPWQKTGEHFIFKKATNGIREMLRVELPWITRLFGKVKRSTVSGARYYTRVYKIDDYLHAELEFANGNRGVIIFDLLSPQVVKRLDIISAERVVTWHERKNEFEIRRRNSDSIRGKLPKKTVISKYKFHEDAHLEEMRHVINVIKGREKNKLVPAQELEILHLIDKITRRRRT